MEIILILLFGFGAIFLVTVAVSIVFKLVKFTTISISKIVQLVFILAAIVVLSLIISGLLFEPFYYGISAGTNPSSDGTASMVVFGIVLAVLVLLFGRTPPFKVYGILFIAFNISITVLSALLIYDNSYFSSIDSVDIFSIYLVFINIFTFFVYGYDKFIAWIFSKSPTVNGLFSSPSRKHPSPKLGRWFEKCIPGIKPQRVPEWILHWHSIFGGSIGAFFGQRFFNHKTKNEKFQPVFIRAIAIQIVLLIGIFAINLSF